MRRKTKILDKIFKLSVPQFTLLSKGNDRRVFFNSPECCNENKIVNQKLFFSEKSVSLNVKRAHCLKKIQIKSAAKIFLKFKSHINILRLGIATHNICVFLVV